MAAGQVKERKFTGWHMVAMMVAFFGVVAAVNLTMVRIAVGSFGGVLVENSYVASQEFNGWLAQAEAQEALGWEVTSSWQDDHHLAVSVVGAPDPLNVTATIRHPLGQGPESNIVFERTGSGEYVSTEIIPQERWIMRLQIAFGQDEWRREAELR